MSYTFQKTVNKSLEETHELVTKSFADEGFGILFRIDMHEKFKAALDKDFRPYIILGACYPQNGYEAIEHDPAMGALLPCNVVIQQLDENQTRVDVVDPKASMSMVDDDKIQEIADDIKRRIEKVIKNF